MDSEMNGYSSNEQPSAKILRQMANQLDQQARDCNRRAVEYDLDAKEQLKRRNELRALRDQYEADAMKLERG